MGGVSQPSGTLVCGNLRRAAQEVTMANQAALQDTLAENSMMSSNQSWTQPSSPGNSSRPSIHGSSARPSLAAKTATPSKSTRRSMVARQDDASTKQDWMSMWLVDAIEAL